jgi:hypothetical protein
MLSTREKKINLKEKSKNRARSVNPKKKKRINITKIFRFCHKGLRKALMWQGRPSFGKFNCITVFMKKIFLWFKYNKCMKSLPILYFKYQLSEKVGCLVFNEFKLYKQYIKRSYFDLHSILVSHASLRWNMSSGSLRSLYSPIVSLFGYHRERALRVSGNRDRMWSVSFYLKVVMSEQIEFMQKLSQLRSVLMSETTSFTGEKFILTKKSKKGDDNTIFFKIIEDLEDYKNRNYRRMVQVYFL